MIGPVPCATGARFLDDFFRPRHPRLVFFLLGPSVVVIADSAVGESELVAIGGMFTFAVSLGSSFRETCTLSASNREPFTSGREEEEGDERTDEGEEEGEGMGIASFPLTSP